MTRVYVDPSCLLLPPPGGGGDDVVVPGAAEALVHLVDAGFDVILLGQAGPTADDLPAGLGRAADLPDHLGGDDWYLTGDPYPAFGRPRGGTTVLVGPHRPAGKLPLPRFDVETRDLPATAIEILSRDAQG